MYFLTKKYNSLFLYFCQERLSDLARLTEHEEIPRGKRQKYLNMFFFCIFFNRFSELAALKKKKLKSYFDTLKKEMYFLSTEIQ